MALHSNREDHAEEKTKEVPGRPISSGNGTGADRRASGIASRAGPEKETEGRSKI